MRKTAQKSNQVFLRIALLIGFVCALTATCPGEQLPIKTYTTADGLARDHVTRIVQDSRGFLWFCTAEGLSRFDGYQFINYGTRQGLPNRAVNDLLEARDGTYWVATFGGLARFAPASAESALGNATRFVVFPLDEDERARDVTVLRQDRAGIVWCGTHNGLYRLEKAGDGWRATRVELGMPSAKPYDREVSSLLADRQGSVWVGAESGLYRSLPDGRVEHYTTQQGLPGNAVLALLEDRNGTLWVGTAAGLCRLVPNPDTSGRVVARVYTSADGLLNNLPSSLVQTSDGRIWVGEFGGLVSLDPEGAPSGPAGRGYTTAQGLSDNAITALTEDSDGNLWIGSDSGGAMKLSRGGFTTYREADGLNGVRIGSIIEDQAGELCVISGGTSLGSKAFNLFDGARFVSSRINLPPGAGMTWGWYQTTFQDHLGDWWVNTSHGTYRYPKATNGSLPASYPKRNYTTDDGLQTNDVFRQYEDARGDVWFSTLGNENAALARWSRADDSFHRYTPQDDGVPPSAPTAFADDDGGNLWIGFYDGGLARYRDGNFTAFSKSDGLPDGMVRGLYLDHKKRLWVATSLGGVARVDETFAAHPRFSVLTSGDGLASDQVTCITEDEWGRIYLGTGRGVDRLDPETGHVKHYTSADGLPDNFINVSFRDRRGILWFGTLRGLARLVPVQDPPASPPPILISSLRAGNTEHPVPELGTAEITSIELGPSENRIQAEFVSLSFSSGETLRYQYKLEGADKDWGAPTLQRNVNYANLAPGAYRFLVRAINADGIVSAQPATISFRVLPPIWRRWWFIALAGLFVLSGTFSVVRYRVARLRERSEAEQALRRSQEEQFRELERVRKRIASDLHDEIGSSLTQISLLSEVLQQRIDGEDSTVTAPLATIATSSRELVDSMSDIVWAINPKKDHLSDLVQRMRSLASELFTACDVKFRFRAPVANINLRWRKKPPARRVFMTYKESINNNIDQKTFMLYSAADVRTPSWMRIAVALKGER